MPLRAFVGIVALAIVASLVGCSSSSPSRELAHDSSRDTIAGPRPTAPPSTEYSGPGLSTEAVTLLQQLRDFQSETDLCAILTSKTIKSVLSGQADLSAMVTTPSGIAQVLVALDSFFAHLVDIAPAPIRPSMAVIQSTWKDLSRIDADALDRDQQIEAISKRPEVDSSVQSLGRWMQTNCSGALGPTLDLGGLLGGLAPA